mmetsp:Transcript_22525/g.35008  ORF Transcript_22525/g.35008 Transcript_22525/m.35008 type:complete len:82 (-) Transcript_22525:44-289(-)
MDKQFCQEEYEERKRETKEEEVDLLVGLSLPKCRCLVFALILKKPAKRKSDLLDSRGESSKKKKEEPLRMGTSKKESEREN